MRYECVIFYLSYAHILYLYTNLKFKYKLSYLLFKINKFQNLKFKI